MENNKNNMGRFFSLFTRKFSSFCGNSITSISAFLLIVGWLCTGAYFNYSDTWQLVINTATSVITFLVVFLIQNTQNRDGQAIQIKLDEIIRAHGGSHNLLLDIEELSQKELEQLRTKYKQLAAEARQEKAQGKSDTEIVEINDIMD